MQINIVGRKPNRAIKDHYMSLAFWKTFGPKLSFAIHLLIVTKP